MTEDPTIQFGAESQTQAAPPPSDSHLDATWGGFQLLTRVGAGGFGEVYRAWDPSLQREIALKLLLPGALDTEAEYQITLREARALASVRHPNIVSIYGCDRHNGRVGFWTDFIHGKTLASLLVVQGPFGYHEAALIGLEVTRALSAVHRANLLHRDIKPENVMREEGGRILLMDFGLSALPQHTSQLAGTPNYMAPELFRRQPASVASDIYAVGVLLYFLVTGQTPARLNGLTTAQAADACTHRKPLIDLRSDLPETFLRIVNRAIALAPDERYRSAGEMAEALAGSLGASPPAQPAPAPPPIAFAAPEKALPKHVKQEKKSRVRLAIGAIVLLFVFRSRIPVLRDIHSHHATSAAKDTQKTEAVDPDDKPDPSDLFEQAQSLLLKSYKESNLTAAIDKFQQIPSSDPNYPLAQAGLGSAYFIQYRNSEDPKLLDQSIAETNKAIKLDPDAAPPYVTLARIAAMQGKNAQAMQLAEKAMSLDHSNADAYRAQADVLDAEGRHDEAIAMLQKAADLAPDDWRFPMNLGVLDLAAGKLQDAADAFRKSAQLAQDNGLAYYNLGLVELRLNQLNQAQGDLDRALALDPHAGAYEAISYLNLQKGDFEAAVTASEKAKAMDPTSYVAWHSLGDAYRMVPADHDQAIEAYRNAIHFAEEIHKKEPKNAELLASLAMYYARVGDASRAATMIRQAILLAPDDPRVDYMAGQAAEIVGDRKQAIILIAKCIGVGYSLAEINRNPDLASLRADPRFQQQLHQAAALKS